MQMFFHGAIMMGCLTAALFFARFFRDTRDRFFLWFAAAFALLGVERLAIAWLLGGVTTAETSPLVYLIRCVAFLLICFAVVEKNKAGKSSKSG